MVCVKCGGFDTYSVWPANNQRSPADISRIAALEAELAEAKQSWRCFFCDEVFTTTEAAHEHFGDDCCEPMAACKLNELEGGILKLYREALRALEDYQNDSDRSSKFFYEIGAAHAVALKRAEEDGYAKGLRDGTYAAGVRDGRSELEAELADLHQGDKRLRAELHTMSEFNKRICTQFTALRQKAVKVSR